MLSQLTTPRLASGLIIGLCLLSLIPLGATAQGTLTLSVNRNVGMAFGNYISGTFTLSGSGPDSIQNLTVYFNNDEVHFVDGNTVRWQFNTGNYPGGATNITLVGVDDVGQVSTTTARFVFISNSISTVLTIGILALASVLILVKYGSRLLQSKTK